MLKIFAFTNKSFTEISLVLKVGLRKVISLTKHCQHRNICLVVQSIKEGLKKNIESVKCSSLKSFLILIFEKILKEMPCLPFRIRIG